MGLDFSKLEGLQEAGRTASSASRPYKAMYRTVWEFQERHSPAGQSLEYWERVAEDLSEVSRKFNGDPFMIGLLLAVFEELERQSKAVDLQGGASAV